MKNNQSKDALGDRMKGYEKLVQQKFMPRLPIIVRLDGKGFSKWTKKFKRPFDMRMSIAMIETTRKLVKETSALIGYTQSDEITLVLYQKDHRSQVYFDGKICKIHSILASMTTAYFNEHIKTTFKDTPGDIPSNLPLFDCRAFQVPTLEEAANCVLWRELDATKNSVSMATRAYYSHSQVVNKNQSDMMDMLIEKGINWNDYPAFFKRGRFIRREKVEKIVANNTNSYEWGMIGDVYTRSEYNEVDMPPFIKVSNRVGVIFDNEDPQSFKEEG